MAIDPRLALAIILYVIAGILTYFFLSGFVWGAGFEPTRKKDIDIAARLLGLKEGMLVYDLGSGTGDVVIYLARKYGVKCIGFEIDPLKVWITRRRISLHPELRNLIEIRRENFLRADISNADSFYVFLSGGSGIMRKLESKLSKEETKDGAKIATYVHVFPNFDPESIEGQIRVYSISSLKRGARIENKEKVQTGK